MSKENKYGFVYLWYDRKHKRFYVGCRWGHIDDGYICSSSWMKQAYGHRPKDFKRRILKTNICSRKELYEEEQRWLNMIKPEEIKPNTTNPRYYNLNIFNNEIWHKYDEHIKSVGQKISKSKKGKLTGPRDPSVGRKISETKKAKKIKFTEEHIQKIIESKRRNGTIYYSEERKKAASENLKKQWADGKRKRKEPKKKMTKEEQGKHISNRLKTNWNDPVWRERQIAKLKEGSQRRWSRDRKIS